MHWLSVEHLFDEYHFLVDYSLTDKKRKTGVYTERYSAIIPAPSSEIRLYLIERKQNNPSFVDSNSKIYRRSRCVITVAVFNVRKIDGIS